ncbi:MAG: lysozyme inhibitor LprI family protein [Trinickia sp.]|uniref:lysozyme inhibitor LprI family protein n=1 Tax=Trinickia sp. TaxID=2571163 RepID=UPI003F81FB7D
MRAIVFVTVFVLSSSALSAASAQAVATQDERTIREQCSGDSEAGMHDCLVKKARESDKALKDAERNAANSLARWDEDANFIGQAQTKLRLSSKAFERYREAQCAFAASIGGGAIGNALDMRRLACVTELNNRRTVQLQATINGLPMR